MYQGIEGFNHYGIDKALWVVPPGLGPAPRTCSNRSTGTL